MKCWNDEKNRGIQMQKLDKKNIEDVLALTPMQEGMLFHYLKEPGGGLYFEQLSLEIAGTIDNEVFENAWNFVIQTNEMLRAVFRWEKVEHPIQIILKEYKLQPRYYDFPGKKTNEKKKWLEKIKVKDRKEKFDLREVPFRVTLCKIAEEKYQLIISNHHILYDGWSNGIILKEFFKAYNDLEDGKPLKPLFKTKFIEFVKWLRYQETTKQEEYWKEYLEDFKPRTVYPVKKTIRKEIKSTGNYQIKLPGEIKDKLACFVKNYNITMASLVYSVWGILLQHYNFTNDVIFDTTVSGRTLKLKEIENMVGLFINTLSLRVQTNPGEKISHLLSRMYHRLQKRGIFENICPLNIKEYLHERRKEQLFDSVVVLENYPLDRILMQENGPFTVNSFCISGMTVYDLSVIVTAFDGIKISFIYNKKLFDEESIVKLSHLFTYILHYILNHPGKRVNEIRIEIGSLGDEERRQILTALRNITNESESPAAKYIAPTNETEKKLVEIWSQVLGIEKEQIGIYDNFFEFGGHSLAATMIVSKLHKAFDVKVPLMEIFKTPFIRGLAIYIQGSVGDKYISIDPVEKKEYYPLSSAQKRLYVSQQMDLDNTCYNTTQIFILGEDIGKRKLEATFRKLILRHESLRTSFEMIDDEPFQKIHQEVEFSIKYYDWECLVTPVTAEKGGVEDEDKDEGKVEECAGRGFIELTNNTQKQITHIIEKFVRPFDLAAAPLLRVGRAETGRGEYIMLVDMHHIISDDVTYEILVKEFAVLLTGEEPQDLRIQYRDFSQWQNRLFESRAMKSQEEYWLEQFAGEIPVLDVPTDYRKTGARFYEGERLFYKFDRALSKKLINMAKETGTTLYILLLAAYNILLSKYSRQEDIVIGAAVSGRRHEDLYNIIGMFVNMIAIRNRPAGSKRFKDFLEEVKLNALEAFENQDYQFEKLVSKLNINRDKNRNPLFDAAFLIKDVETGKSDSNRWRNSTSNYLNISSYKYEKKSAEFSLLFLVETDNDNISLTLEYRTGLFKRITVEKIVKRYVDILKQIVGNRNMKIKDFKISLDLLPVKLTFNEQHLGQFEF
jgi:non-ribosomal peptide synthetase component F